MAYPTSPTDGAGYRIGMIVKKVSSTLTAALVRAIAITTGGDPVGWMGTATHVEDDPAVVSDAGSVTPLVLMGGKRGSHVTVSAAGDVSAVQVDASGNLQVAGTVTAIPSIPSSFNVPAALTVGTGEATHVTGTGCRRLRIYNNHASNVLYYRHATGVTTSNGFPIQPGAQDELEIAAGVTVYLTASGASTDVRLREERT